MFDGAPIQAFAPVPLTELSNFGGDSITFEVDSEGMIKSRLAQKDFDRLRAVAEGTYVPPAKAPFDLKCDALYGGVSGLTLPMDEFELASGLSLASTYAHVMAPFLMAFAPPPRISAPHPGPWASLYGRGLNILAEVRLAAGAKPLRFDRLNTLWFVVALLRLRLAQPLQIPVLADRALGDVPSDVERSNLLPVELDLSRPVTAPVRAAKEADLVWLAEHLDAADLLMTDPVFNRAFRTLDHAVAIENAGAGIVIAWAAIESLLRPGSQRITERISRALAAYLHPPRAGRDRAFASIVKSYEARGGAAHAGRIPEAKQFQTAFQLARAAFLKTIEEDRLPDIEVLLERWRTGT
jgi:hypothetical protein